MAMMKAGGWIEDSDEPDIETGEPFTFFRSSALERLGPHRNQDYG